MSTSNSELTIYESDQNQWAPPVTRLKVSSVPAGAENLNVDGRRTSGPLQGFGQLWQKTYRVRLSGAQATPEEVVRIWKERFPSFQPPENRFYPSMAGIKPGEVVLINASVGGLPVDGGVLVLYADDESFTFLTPEGFPEAGWNTFSAFEEDGATVAQIQSLARATDPIYEIGFRLMGSQKQEQIWAHVLTALADYFGVHGEVRTSKSCVDPKLQWAHAGNVWQNGAIRTLLHTMLAPARNIVQRLAR